MGWNLTDCAGMSLLKFVDNAFPMSSWPAADGFAFYIGGDTPHVWSDSEVATLKQHYRYLLPIFVRSNPPGPGAVADVSTAVSRLKALGAPQGTLVAWDMEMAADSSYMGQVYGALSAAGFVLIDYGSEAFVFGNRNPDGYYWGADWTNVPHLANGTEITQWASFAAYDVSEATSALPFWDVKGGPVPPPPPPAGLSWLTGAQVSGILGKLPELKAGSSNTAHVKKLQAVLDGVWRKGVAQDGNFGASTTAAVKSVQRMYHLAADGIVGPQTWKLVAGGSASSPRIPVLKASVADGSLPHWYVHRVQAVLNASYGAKLTVDGSYGPATKAAVEAAQAKAKVTKDGVAGQATWGALLA